MLLAQLVKLAEQSAHQGDGLCWLTLCAELREASDLRVEQCHILQLINDLLIVLDALQHMFRHQLREKLFSSLDLYVDDSIIVIDLATAHLASMDQYEVEESVNDDESGVSDVRLYVDRVLNDVPVVLRQEHNKHDQEERGQLTELE